MRHGEVHNPQGILYGRLPGYHLSALGQAMAQAGADYFTTIGADIATVIASPLLRAQQTAIPVARAYGLNVDADWRLIEAANDFEGVAVNANRWALAHPTYWRCYRNPFRPSWGEPYQDQVDRMRAVVSATIDKVAGREAVLVSHQLPIWVLRLFAEGRPLPHDPRRRECALGSVTSYIFENHTLLGVEYVEPSAHLMSAAQDVTPGVSLAELNHGQ